MAELGHHCGLDREQGGVRYPRAALELASDKRLRSGMWSRSHVFLAELSLGLMKIDFITSAAIGNDNFLVEDAQRIPRIYILKEDRNVKSLHRVGHPYSLTLRKASCVGIEESFPESGCWLMVQVKRINEETTCRGVGWAKGTNKEWEPPKRLATRASSYYPWDSRVQSEGT